MLRAVLIFLAFSFSIKLFAQSYKDSINSQFLRYTDLLIKKDFVKSADYINPDFFKIIPKSQLIVAMENTFNSKDFDFNLEKPTILSIGNSVNVGGNNYVKLQYSNYMLIHLKQDNETKQDTSLTKKTFETQFGQNNVTYDQSTDTYRIYIVKNVVANSSDKLKWTFVVIEERQKPILEKFIPKELL